MDKTRELTPDIEMRLNYADKCFQNMQELIRFMDQKAGFVLAAVGILSAALGSLIVTIFQTAPTNSIQATLRATSGGLLIAYLIVAFLVIWVAIRVFTAQPDRPQNTAAPELIYPIIYLNKSAPNMQYLETLAGLTPTDILHDYTDQIIEITEIYRKKKNSVNASVRLFQLSSVLWILTVLVFLAWMATT
jgi:hypothetical protein